MILFLKKYAVYILVLFHLIGWIGLAFVDTAMFANLSPLTLLLSVLLIAVCHQGAEKPFVILLISTAVLGYLVEVLGVKTGFPFGSYSYGPALGPRLMEVPLIIGINWFLLVTGSGFLAKALSNVRWLQVTIATLVMVILDVAIEAVAPRLNYWYWKDDIVPLENYLGWLAVALIMQLIFQKTIVTHNNKLAIPYIVTVAVFFALLNFSL